GSPPACDVELLLGDVDAGHLRSHAGQSEDDLIVAAAEYRDPLAGDIAQPFEFGRMQGERRVTVTSFPDAARIGAMSPGCGTGIPAATIGLVETTGHADAHDKFAGDLPVRPPHRCKRRGRPFRVSPLRQVPIERSPL